MNVLRPSPIHPVAQETVKAQDVLTAQLFRAEEQSFVSKTSEKYERQKPYSKRTLFCSSRTGFPSWPQPWQKRPVSCNYATGAECVKIVLVYTKLIKQSCCGRCAVVRDIASRGEPRVQACRKHCHGRYTRSTGSLSAFRRPICTPPAHH